MNLITYAVREKPSPTLSIQWTELELHSYDRWDAGGSASGHYFWQDLWAAKEIYQRKFVQHWDVGSRIDGFIAHILPFCQVFYVDIRPLESNVPNLSFICGSILTLPFESGTIPSLSCLHVIEHIGLGRYGDPVDPFGHIKAARELSRVLAPGGTLLLGTPVGRERLVFDGHRTFSASTVISMFPDLQLINYKIIPDTGESPIEDPHFTISAQQDSGCGLFVFQKRLVGSI